MAPVSFVGTVSAEARVRVVVAPVQVGVGERGSAISVASKLPVTPALLLSLYRAIPELVAVVRAARSVDVEKPTPGFILNLTLASVSDELTRLKPITAVGLLDAIIV